MKVNIDETRVISTIALIENHLDGAVSDFEQGGVDNVAFLDDLVYMHKLLTAVSTNGWSSLVPDEYEERMEKAKERLGKKNDDETK